MSETVFLLGAGFSRDSGIPLLGDFAERMWHLAVRPARGTTMADEDRRLLARALEIRDELDSYHGRAMFNDRNIEDLLSLLSFNLLSGGRGAKTKLEAMTLAIARTIELTCDVRHSGIDPSRGTISKEGPDLYRRFWQALFKTLEAGYELPTIITFNYDLVLERSLLQVLIGTHYGASTPLPFRQVQVQYHYKQVPPTPYEVKYTAYTRHGMGSASDSEGTLLAKASPASPSPLRTIELLKLHGSLNFPRSRTKLTTGRFDDTLTKAVSDPFILPPVFNKLAGDKASPMWATAIARLRSAKNLIVVGYSLPTTDVYMQYFLRAGVGPNKNFNKVVVFDPVLFADVPAGRAMRERYAGCFAPQLQERIDFHPSVRSQSLLQGSTQAFVNVLSNEPERLLF